MAELKTKENSASVLAFLNSIEHPTRKADSLVLLALFEKLTKEKAKMWGVSIVGFGNIHYVYASGREGDWMATGFSPRKANMSLYVLSSFPEKDALLEKLGKYKTGKSCLYVNSLADIDMQILETLIKKSYAYALKHQNIC
jgi:nucleoid DNA-binding protein